ncbi:class I SAM-dependent methyltransferase [Methanolobus vulcani]|uniref:Class I SAM-dependent methyltransferase n=1 Tax=Methanolobus vulcani TaxID=38026 RepID=A0A7Z8KPX2_9EURY|nr:class I SAM-dependent methyltransferase [Methanolobus vulcani]TQD27263.1 class I SAM-dependent methyltransferase [Methanolobus vulcani]
MNSKLGPNQEKKVKNYFSNYANAYYKENYDGSLKNCYSYSHIVRKNHIMRMIDFNQGRILDIGCGPGVITYSLLLQGHEVWGVDVSESMIKEASERIEQTEFKQKAHFSVGDITSLDFPDNYFDAVICSGVLEYLENDDKALKEIYRVLKFEGVAIFGVPKPRKIYAKSIEIIRKILMPSVPTLVRIKRKRSNREYRGDSSTRYFGHNTYTSSTLDSILNGVGFKKLDYANYHFVSLFLCLLAPNLSLKVGEKLDELYYKSTCLSSFSKGYIVKVQK